MNRLLSLSLVGFVLVAGCDPLKDLKHTCTTTADCGTVGVCDVSTGVGVCKASCGDTNCAANQQCLNNACVATSCLPACNANQQCDLTANPPKCNDLADGTVTLNLPDGSAVIGGASVSVKATAGAPGGPTKVQFRIEQGGAAKATLDVATGTAGDFTGTLPLQGGGLVTGAATAIAKVYWTQNGVDKTKESAPVSVTVDEDAPSITAPATDKAFYSSTATTPSPIALVSVQINDIGAAGVDPASARLVIPGHSYPAGVAPDGGAGTYQFSVTTSDLGVAAGQQGPKGYVVTAADNVGNAQSFDGGTIAIDNEPPVFANLVADGGIFYGGDAGVPLQADVTDPAGGSGLDAGSVAVRVVGAASGIAPVSSLGATYKFLPLGSALIAAGQQASVPVQFEAADNVGNAGQSAAQSIKVDRAPPAVTTVSVTDNPANNGFYPADGTTIAVDVVADDGTAGSGAAKATLAFSNTPIVACGAACASSSPTGSGTAKTFHFSIPSNVGTAGIEASLPFSITVTDAVGNPLTATPATARLKIDDRGPDASTLAVVTVPEFTDTNAVKWYRQALGGNIEITATVTDAGSGVKLNSLKLALQSDATKQVDGATAVTGPDAGTSTYHFFIPRSGTNAGQIGAGAQGTIQFQVVGTDNLGHPLTSTTTGKVGIDGQAPAAPSLDFTAQYPANNAGCGTGALCGHDNAHFWRNGDDGASIAFTASDGASGSGLNTNASATCQFATPNGETPTHSQPACSITYPGGAGTGTVTYHFTLNPSTLGLNTDVAGNGAVTASVNVQDAVGNISLSTAANLSLTRVKWVRQLTGGIINLSGAPVLTPPIGTTTPARQLIVGGTGTGTLSDSIYSLGLDGAVIGSAGHSASPIITSVSTAMAFSANTNKLYVLTNSASAYVFTVAAGGPATPSACNFGASGGTTGSPALTGNTVATEFAMVADSGNNRLQAVSGNGGCSNIAGPVIPNASNALSTPTTSGTLTQSVFLGAGSDVAHLTWDGSTLALVPHTGVGVNPTTSVSLVSGLLFLGDDNKFYHAFNVSDFSPDWTSPALSGAVASAPIVNDGYVYGTASALDGHLRAFDSVVGTQAWQYPSDATKINLISPVAIGGLNTVYFTDKGNSELVALQYSKAGAPAQSVIWNYKGQASFRGSDTRFTGGGPEPTIGADGTLYFVDGSSVYAILTDTGASVTPSGGTNWPRVGFDNCNAGNTSYTNCQ